MIDYFLLSRLQDNLKRHGSLIIAFDFDDTVFPLFKSKDEVLDVVETLKLARSRGHKLICYTCRGDEKEVKSYCNKIGLMYDSFNENLITLEGQTGKLYYNVFLDDKAGLQQTLFTLKEILN